jgi:DNA-binding beta-propeller fold protein YncE
MELGYVRHRTPPAPHVARALLSPASMSISLRIVISSTAPRRHVRVAAPAVAVIVALASSLLTLAACNPESPGGGGPDPGDPVVDAGPPPDTDTGPWCPPYVQGAATSSVTPCLPPWPWPPLSARYSLEPAYQTTPEAALGQFEIYGRTMAASDFQTAAVEVSVAQKLEQLDAQLAHERGVATVDIFPDAERRERAAGIPFRGNPSDVAILTVDGKRKAYVPLGGDAMTPGNEVAIVALDSGEVTRVQVGVHPQQVHAHASSGLVFVCNQYSSYISVIDSRTDALLYYGGEPVEIATATYCTDLVVAERNPDFGEVDEVYLFVANEHRGSVLEYRVDIERDINDDIAGVHVVPPPGQHEVVPETELWGVGASPSRLHLDESGKRIYVASHRGGELAMIDIATNRVIERVELGAPAIDVVQVGAKLFVPTTTPHRGLLQQGAPTAGDVQAAPVTVTGVDGQPHEVHPGARFDATASYDVEDLRSGIFQLEVGDDIEDEIRYVTDDNDADGAFAAEQKQLAGALPWSIARNAGGTSVYVPLFGADLVQELDVTADAPGLRASGRTFVTRELPSAVAVDEDAGQLVVVSFGADVLEIFDLASADIVSEIDLGYALPRYPATVIEAGEYLFATARWSNDGRKSCAGCHSHRLSTDGLGFAVGTAAPTTLRPVRPMHDLFATGPYLWTGGAPGGSLGAMAFAAQARTNCELVLYGLVEGPHAAPAQRAGDPANFTAGGAGDARCRPDTGNLDPATGLPGSLDGGSFDDIRAEILVQEQTAALAMTQAVRAQLVSAGLFQDDPAFDRQAIERAIGFYTVAELRLPANPLAQQREVEVLDVDLVYKLQNGEELFRGEAGCASCHDPEAQAHPFTDNRYFGLGSGWVRAFVTAYATSPVLGEILPDGVPAPLAAAATVETVATEPTIFQPVLDGLVPFCFSQAQCLRLDDPLAVRGSDGAEEARRLRRLATIYLAGAGFFPGSIVGQPMVNTPSLRGLWLQRSLLHHGLARSIEEAILPPGHAALRDGQRGYAVDAQGAFDVHGSVGALNETQIEALGLYLRSIE